MSLVSDEQLLALLFNINKWWTSGNFPAGERKPAKRLAFYEAQKYLYNPRLRRAVLFTGLRRVGKTTIMYQLIEDLLNQGIPAKNILYVSFDHPIIKVCKMDRILQVYQNNVAQGEEVYLFFDEVHYAEDWNFWLKTLVDQNPGYKISATGSASPLLSVQRAETGVGRWVDIKVPTLSFYEYCILKNVPAPKISQEVNPNSLHSLTIIGLADLVQACSRLLPHFHRYLLIGGFPELVMLDDLDLSQKLLREDIVDKVLKRDMTAVYNIRNVNELEKLFIFLCLQSGNIIKVQSLCQELKSARPTVENYIQLLSMANIIYVSDLVDNTGKKALKSKPKIYLADAAIRNAVLLRDETILADATEMGMVVETTVYKHLAAYYYRQQPKVGYWRGGKKDKEIDTVVAFPNGKRLLVEVKYREVSDIAQDAGIVTEAKDANSSAIILTKKPDDFGFMQLPTPRPIVKIPTFVYLYLLGYSEMEAFNSKKP